MSIAGWVIIAGFASGVALPRPLLPPCSCSGSVMGPAGTAPSRRGATRDLLTRVCGWRDRCSSGEGGPHVVRVVAHALRSA